MSTKHFSAKVPKAGIYQLNIIFNLSVHKGLVQAQTTYLSLKLCPILLKYIEILV